MTVEEFLSAFAADVGATVPNSEEIESLLEVASIAAHSSERLAAPLTCWIAGASGRPVAEILDAARRVVQEDERG